jgi:hypothetical protein
MPGRLDRVRIVTRYGYVEIRWECRETLLAEIHSLESESARDVVRAFEAVGATQPVELDLGGKVVLVEAIHAVGRDVGGMDRLTTDVRELLCALVDELEREHIG